MNRYISGGSTSAAEEPAHTPEQEEQGFFSPQYGYIPYDTPQSGEKIRSRVFGILRQVFGWLGTAAVLLLMIGAKWSGDIISSICLMLAALMLLPVGAMDRFRRRILPKTWLRGILIAALIIAALSLHGVSGSAAGSDADPQTAVTQTVTDAE